MIKFSKKKYNKKRLEYLSDLLDEDKNRIEDALSYVFGDKASSDLSNYSDNDVKRALTNYFKNLF